MGKNRTINTNIWKDDKIYEKFTAEDKIFWLYLLTNEKTNNLGCYKFDIRMSSYDLGYSEETIKNVLVRFNEYHKVIIYDYKTNEILIINYGKYNWTASPTYQKGLENEYELIESKDLRVNVLALLQSFYGTKTSINETNGIIVKKAKENPTTAIVRDIIAYYNAKTGAKLTTKNKTINSLINARIKEGATLEDFKNVLDYKYDDWFNDDTMAAYYRPNTLFTSKFHDYLSSFQMGVPAGNKTKKGKGQRIRKQDDNLWEILGG